jgi:hypothetical protein
MVGITDNTHQERLHQVVIADAVKVFVSNFYYFAFDITGGNILSVISNINAGIFHDYISICFAFPKTKQKLSVMAQTKRKYKIANLRPHA